MTDWIQWQSILRWSLICVWRSGVLAVYFSLWRLCWRLCARKRRVLKVEQNLYLPQLIEFLNQVLRYCFYPPNFFAATVRFYLLKSTFEAPHERPCDIDSHKSSQQGSVCWTKFFSFLSQNLLRIQYLRYNSTKKLSKIARWFYIEMLATIMSNIRDYPLDKSGWCRNWENHICSHSGIKMM